MLFIISLVIVFAVSFGLSKTIKKYPYLFYIAAALLSAAGYFIDVHSVPAFVAEYLAPLVTNCILGTAMWFVVMSAGALPNGSWAIKKLMPIRGELSITAAILTVGHILRYGINYLQMLTAGRGSSTEFMISFIVALLLVVIMTPLTVISIKFIRKKMKPKVWKNIQRFAYGFYALIYLHIIVVGWSKAAHGNTAKYIDIICYTVMFALYAVMRIRKYILLRRKPEKKITLNTASVVLTAACVALVAVFAFPVASTVSTVPVRTSTAVQVAPLPTEEASSSVSESTEDPIVTESSVIAAEESSNKPSQKNSKAESSKAVSQSSTASKPAQSSQTSRSSQNGQTSTAAQNSAPQQQQQITQYTVEVPVDNGQTQTVETPQTDTNNTNNNTANNTDNNTNTTTVQNPQSGNTVTNPSQSQTQTQTQPTQPVQEQPAPEPEPVNKIYNDGVYTATAYGYDGDITVSVTIKDDTIISISASSMEEDLYYFDSARDTVISQIITSQNPNVDAVSGATYSSKGIMNAVQAALNAARI